MCETFPGDREGEREGERGGEEREERGRERGGWWEGGRKVRCRLCKTGLRLFYPTLPEDKTVSSDTLPPKKT